MQDVVNEVRGRVACKNLGIRAERSLLADFSWSHEPRGIAWLVGSNGSGKSSLLRVLAGWQKPAAGRVIWSGLPVRRIHYYSPAMSAGGDVRAGDFASHIRSLCPLAMNVHLSSLYPETITPARRFAQLSTGEAKRVLLWAILAAGRGPLLLDEPYEHLSRDAKHILTELLQARAAQDVVIIATNQDVPERSIDAVLCFDGDRIEVQYAS